MFNEIVRIEYCFADYNIHLIESTHSLFHTIDYGSSINWATKILLV